MMVECVFTVYPFVARYVRWYVRLYVYVHARARACVCIWSGYIRKLYMIMRVCASNGSWLAWLAWLAWPGRGLNSSHGSWVRLVELRFRPAGLGSHPLRHLTRLETLG